MLWTFKWFQYTPIKLYFKSIKHDKRPSFLGRMADQTTVLGKTLGRLRCKTKLAIYCKVESKRVDQLPVVNWWCFDEAPVCNGLGRGRGTNDLEPSFRLHLVLNRQKAREWKVFKWQIERVDLEPSFMLHVRKPESRVFEWYFQLGQQSNKKNCFFF